MKPGTVRQIMDGATERNGMMDWKIVITSDGRWGYTTYKSIQIGDEVQIATVDDDFLFYIAAINGKLTKKGKAIYAV